MLDRAVGRFRLGGFGWAVWVGRFGLGGLGWAVWVGRFRGVSSGGFAWAVSRGELGTTKRSRRASYEQEEVEAAPGLPHGAASPCGWPGYGKALVALGSPDTTKCPSL